MDGNDQALREHVRKLLSWEDAHVGLNTVLADLPVELRGVRPPGCAHSVWELVEHLRMAQRDILEFCVTPAYQEMSWPDDYWPASPAPSSPDAWDESLRGYREDLEALRQLAADPGIDLGARIPHGSGQTYLRELLLVADHTAYHVGQLVLVRRLLGSWPAR
jgi:nucleotide-binding universal stress UspA family protein